MSDLLIVQNVACEGPGLITTLSQKNGISYTVRRAWEEDVVKDSGQFGALIILGGPMNVYEEGNFPFLKAEGQLIQGFLEDGKPILGICLGAQLFAKALGARVFAGPCKEIGWHPLQLTPQARQDMLFQSLGETFMAFHWHEDNFELPRGAVHLAQSSAYPNQAFRFGERAYGIQFHLEVTPEMILEWIEHYDLQPSALNWQQSPDTVLANTKRWSRKLAELATMFFSRFFGFLSSQSHNMSDILGPKKS